MHERQALAAAPLTTHDPSLDAPDPQDRRDPSAEHFQEVAEESFAFLASAIGFFTPSAWLIAAVPVVLPGFPVATA